MNTEVGAILSRRMGGGNMFGLSRAEREAAAEVESYLEQCRTSGRKYNPQTHVNKQIKAADKVVKSRRR